MKTHLIMDLNSFGVWSDNYEQFMEKRAEIVSKEIEKRIIKEIDEKPQADLMDDFEYDEYQAE